MADIPRRRRDQLGGAISLWVVLMVPVAAFAAVVAMAGPQRMAAESSMNEAADDLATLAVAIRDGRGEGEGEIEGFLPDCPEIGIDFPPGDTDKQKRQENQQKGLEEVCNLLLGDDASGAEGYLHRDLGYLGINTDSWEGFYSDSIIPNQQEDDAATLDVDESLRPDPCSFADGLLTRDAVYVALAADWEDAGWAAAQAWPNGVRVGEELVARLNQRGSTGDPDNPGPDDPSACGTGRLKPPPDNDPARTAFSD